MLEAIKVRYRAHKNKPLSYYFKAKHLLPLCSFPTNTCFVYGKLIFNILVMETENIRLWKNELKAHSWFFLKDAKDAHKHAKRKPDADSPPR